jgi:hypothetical protein
MSGDGLRFGVLGPLAVERDGEPVALAGAACWRCSSCGRESA